MIDRSILQIFANYCASATEIMAHALMRAAHSSFVKETEDFTTQLVTPAGQTFASPKTLGANWFTGLDYGAVIGMIADYREGDICATSDPYSGFLATHAPDLHVWKPIFHEGEIVCFVACHVHHTDVGGAVPASLSRALTEVHQEGLRIPPMKIVEGGAFDEKVIAIIRSNVRMPDQNWGDLNAQIAAVNTGERKVREMIRRFGIEVFREGQLALLDYAEQQARTLVRKIPDGSYFFSDYSDEDSVGGFPCRVAVTVTVAGDAIVMDFTGSDPQLSSALNMPTGGHEQHALVTIALILTLATLDPHLVLNAGTARVARAILPPGTVMNAQAPAAVGMRSLTVAVSQLALLGAFQQALPGIMPAGPAGGASMMNVKTSDRQGRTIMASIGPISGGGGGSPLADGAEGAGGNRSFLKNTPVEIIEAEVPIKVLRYGLVPDSGGAGTWRGGSAMVMEFQVFSPNSMVTARNRNRTRFASWGVEGGKAGGNSRFLRNPGTNREVDLGNMDVVHCEPGDILRIIGPGGGGHGDPFLRPTDRVLNDVSAGFVSREAAERLYGVVISEDLLIDAQETARLREAPRQLDTHSFDFGTAREEFEQVWTRQRYDRLTVILASIPVNWRHHVKNCIFRAIGDVPGDGEADAVDEAFAVIVAQHPELGSLAQDRCSDAA